MPTPEEVERRLAWLRARGYLERRFTRSDIADWRLTHWQAKREAIDVQLWDQEMRREGAQ